MTRHHGIRRAKTIVKPKMSKNTAQAQTTLQEDEKRDRILLEHLPQVRCLARRIHKGLPRCVPLEDMVNAGVLGLIDAFNKFDGSKHVQFGSYAKFRIRGAILDSLREMDWGPRELRRKARRIEEAQRRLSQNLSRVPLETEVAAELNLDLRKFQRLLRDLDILKLGSVQVSRLGDTDVDLCNYLPAAPEETPLFLCAHSEMQELLVRVFAELPEQQQRMLASYYYGELTMKEVGIELEIGESRVSQIHTAAIVRLRVRLDELMSTAKLPCRTARVVSAE
jgi:RNA polymerase sigma factor FliA